MSEEISREEIAALLARGSEEMTREPCGDTISRQAAIEEIRFGQSFITKIHPTGEIEHLFDKENKALEAAVERIEALPPVTPKPKTGHWIETAEEYYKAVNEYGGGVNEDTPYFVDDIACSECLSMFSVIDNETERFDCCPHCGAKMQEVEE